MFEHNRFAQAEFEMFNQINEYIIFADWKFQHRVYWLIYISFPAGKNIWFPGSSLIL